MSVLKRLHSIFTKNSQSEVGYLSGAIDDSLEKVKDTVTDMELMSVITTATGEWLDWWGDRFHVLRESGESDTEYSERIKESVTNQKGTIPALISAVKRALGEDTIVRAEETYEDLRIFNISTFSGTGKFQDSDTVRLGVVKIFINKMANDKLREEIWKTRSSGIKVIIVEEV